MKTAVSGGSVPGMVIDRAYGPPSDAPIMSMITAFGRRFWKARF